MFESIAVVGPLANKEVGAKIKKCATPVGSPPCRSVIESAVAGLWLTLRQAHDEVVPNALWCQQAGTGLSDRFDIGGESFLKPMVSFRERRKCQMDHLMRKEPVICETGDGRIASQRDGDKRTAPTIGCAIPCSVAGGGGNPEPQSRDWKFPKVV